MRRFFFAAFEVIEVAVIALGAVFLIRTFLVQPFLVSGASMVPTFENGDYILADELSYRLRQPERGEVIVFHFDGRPPQTSTYFIKRVVGLPGDEVIIQGGRIVIKNAEYPEGRALDEPYLPAGTATAPRGGSSESFSLEPGEYLVLGDNRSYSYDSRDWGVVKKTDIIGLVRVRLWPLTELMVFAAPQY